MRRYNMYILLSLVGCMIVGCGTVLSSSTSSGTTAPSASPTSATAAPITITTDRTTYAPTDAIRVMVSNHGDATIYASAGHASCTILTLEVMLNGRWQPSNAAACPSQPAVALVQIAPGATYNRVIRAFQLPAQPGTFAAGEYRLSLIFWNTIQGSVPSINSGTAITSSPFTVG
jgi:hypothetical protein